jgi:hypothetical protein
MTNSVTTQRIVGMNSHRYRTSRDYRELWRLLQTTPVACIADWYRSSDQTPARRDVCATSWSGICAEIGCRSVSYVFAESEDEFVAQCESANVEFIQFEAAAPSPSACR